MRQLPNRPLTNIDLTKFCEKNIQHFRGVFMRDSLPQIPRKLECGIINLDSSTGVGTHWVAYYKSDKETRYFDSFGNLKPPTELVKYLGNKISYNYSCIQKFNSFKCGHLCIKFLLENFEGLKK